MKIHALTLAALVVLSGCGKNGNQVKVQAQLPQVQVVDGRTLIKFDGGATPAVVHTADGWVMAYAGAGVGDRQIYWSRSADGKSWDAPKKLSASSYSDQMPCLATDAGGTLHLYFASNRSGEDWGIFHSRFGGGSFAAPALIAGSESVSDLAVCRQGDQLVLAAETLGLGLAIKTSADGETFTGEELAADAGFEPALTALPDGKLLLAYSSEGNIYTRAGKPGSWSKEVEAASADERLREPALAWSGDQGLLVYAGRTSLTLEGRHFDASGEVSPEPVMLPSQGGEARSPALCAGSDGSTGLIWGMKYSNGQQGIVFSILP